MKPEPLKGKLNEDNDCGCCDMDCPGFTYIENYFYKEDIKSAVKFLKQGINKIPFYDLFDGKKFNRKPILDIIDQAFEDVK